MNALSQTFADLSATLERISQPVVGDVKRPYRYVSLLGFGPSMSAKLAHEQLTKRIGREINKFATKPPHWSADAGRLETFIEMQAELEALLDEHEASFAKLYREAR